MTDHFLIKQIWIIFCSRFRAQDQVRYSTPPSMMAPETPEGKPRQNPYSPHMMSPPMSSNPPPSLYAGGQRGHVPSMGVPVSGIAGGFEYPPHGQMISHIPSYSNVSHPNHAGMMQYGQPGQMSYSQQSYIPQQGQQMQYHQQIQTPYGQQGRMPYEQHGPAGYGQPGQHYSIYPGGHQPGYHNMPPHSGVSMPGSVNMPGGVSMPGGFVGRPGADIGMDQMRLHQSKSEDTLQRPRSAGAQSLLGSSPDVSQLLRHSTSVDTPSTGTSTPSFGAPFNQQQSESSLLPKIKAIQDPQKRLSKLDINLMNLKEDLAEYENQIQKIMVEDPNYFQNEDFQSKNRRKRTHLKEIKELEEYKPEVEAEIQAEYQAEEAQRLRGRFAEMQMRESATLQGHSYQMTPEFTPTGPPAVNTGYPPVTMAHSMVSNHPTTAAASMAHGLVTPKVGHNVAYDPKMYQDQSMQEMPRLKMESKNNDENMKVIRQMLVLDQNPHEWKAKQENDPTLLPEVSFPPSIEDIDQETTKLRKKSGKVESSSKRSSWECQHCTFRNQMTSKACEMCDKTSDEIKIHHPNGSVEVQQRKAGGLVEEAMEECEYCTVQMPLGTKVCPVCARTQERYRALPHEQQVIINNCNLY